MDSSLSALKDKTIDALEHLVDQVNGMEPSDKETGIYANEYYAQTKDMISALCRVLDTLHTLERR